MMSDETTNMPKPGEAGKTELVVKTISSELKDTFDDQIIEFYNTYVNVESLGYQVNLLGTSKHYTITLMGVLFTKDSF